jgi:hypothetical protein
MAELNNQRVKRLSTRYLGFYKYGVIVFIVIAILFLAGYQIINLFYKENRFVGSILSYVYLIAVMVGWLRVNRNVHRVEFDNDFLYVILKDQDILIPLENIKEVDIKSLGGVYEVELYQPEQLGKKFYFKPSLLYPFNFKRKDALVNVLRKNINLAQQKKRTHQANSLHS